jgi:hypothetical protein
MAGRWHGPSALWRKFRRARPAVAGSPRHGAQRAARCSASGRRTRNATSAARTSQACARRIRAACLRLAAKSLRRRHVERKVHLRVRQRHLGQLVARGAHQQVGHRHDQARTFGVVDELGRRHQTGAAATAGAAAHGSETGLREAQAATAPGGWNRNSRSSTASSAARVSACCIRSPHSASGSTRSVSSSAAAWASERDSDSVTCYMRWSAALVAACHACHAASTVPISAARATSAAQSTAMT